MKNLDSSVQLPSKTLTGFEKEIFQRRPIVRFTNDRYGLQKRGINDIRFDDDKFWMEAFVVSYTPLNGDFLEYYDDHTGKSHKEPRKGGKALLPYFNGQLVVTDDDFGAATMKLYISSYDGNGDGFFGSAHECSKNDKKSKDVLKKLVDQKHLIEVLVESIKVGEGGSDKIFRIIGDYEVLGK